MKNKTLRVLAALGVFTVVSLQADLAAAHHVVFWLNCSEFSDPCTPDEGSVIKGAHTVAFDVDGDSAHRIREVKAHLKLGSKSVPVDLQCPFPDEDPATDGCLSEAEGLNDSGRYIFDWDSNVLTPKNGSYSLVVSARAEPHEQPSDDPWIKAARELKVDNAPATPKAPEILVRSNDSISLTWRPAPEVDVMSYELYRAVTASTRTKPTSDQFKSILTTPELTGRDTATKPGAYWYRLAVSRKSVVSRDGMISSAISETSSPEVVPKAATVLGESDTSVPPDSPRLPPLRLSTTAAAPTWEYGDVYQPLLPGFDEIGKTESRIVRTRRAGAVDPRQGVLPVAVGTFLVASALAVGRMPADER